MMKKLSEPDISKADVLLTDVISRKRNQDYIKRLNVNKAYILSRYTVYQMHKKKLENISLSTISSAEDKDAIHSAFNETFKKGIKEKELKDIYEECQNICPYCGERKIEEIDHYIPKEIYPEFTLYPGNLVPLCNKCNKKKGDRFLDSGNKRQFINVYYDEINNVDFLSVDIRYEATNIKKTIKIKYTADFGRIKNAYLKDIMTNHYTNLDLINRFEEAAINEISELLMIVENQSNKEEHDIKVWAEMTIEGNLNGHFKRLGKSNWKYLLYKKLLEIGFVKDLVCYVCY